MSKAAKGNYAKPTFSSISKSDYRNCHDYLLNIDYANK